MRVPLKVKQIHDVDVFAMAIVDQGANMTPFKVMMKDRAAATVTVADAAEFREKQKTMLDFTKKIFQKAKAEPGVVAVVIAAGADLDIEKKRVEAAGYKIDSPEDAKGATILYQRSGVDLNDEKTFGFVKLDDKIGVFCAFNPTEGAVSFDEILNTQGYIPGIQMALSAFQDTVLNALTKEGVGKAETISALQAASDSFGSHLAALTEAVPAEAFMMDPAFSPKEVAKEEEKPETKADPEPEKPAVTEPEEAEKVEAAAKAGEAIEPDATAKALAALTDQISKLATSMETKFRAADVRMGSIEKSTETAGQAAKDALKAAQAVDEAIGGLVGGSAADDPTPENGRGDGDGGYIALMDTAMGIGVELKKK